MQVVNTRTSLTYREHEEVERVLKNFEQKWAPKMAYISLVTELAVPSDEVDSLLEALGTLMVHRRQRLMRVLPAVPACVAVSMTAAAIEVYEGGSFWPGFFERLGCHGGQDAQSMWGNAFHHAIDRFELPKFRADDRRHIGPILAHAGIPNYCLPDYFTSLDMAMRKVGADAAAVAAWALPRVDTALANIDVPVRHFLSRGDEFAVDFIDRSMDLLIRLNRNDNPAAARLPGRVVNAAREYLEGLAARGRGSYTSRETVSESRAKLTLDTAEGELVLTLPAMPRVDEDVTWLISVGDRTDRVTPAKQMGGTSIGIREATFPVRRPTKSIRIAAEGIDRSQEIDLVDADDPILFFSDEGAPLAGNLPLPGAQVWALYALPTGTNEPAFAERIVGDQQAPLGWSGWHLSLVDLKGTPNLRLTDASPVHSVRNDARVALETISVADHVRAAGQPVHVARPTLHIPDGIDAEWHLTVVDVARGATVVDRVVESSADVHDTADPFEGLASPVVGQFSVTMRGPLGKGVSRTVAIAEGLAVEVSTALRTFVRGGLDDARALLSGRDLTIGHQVLDFGADSIEKSTWVSAHSSSLEILVTPPAMAVALAADGVPGRWEHRALAVASEDVARTSLFVRLPRSGSAQVHVVDDAGSRVQILEESTGSTSGGHQAAFSLREISDTVAKYGSCTIEVGDERPIRLARIAPRTLAQGALDAPGGVQLTDFAGGSVAARVWSLFEPWLDPADVSVPTDGSITVPHRLASCGALAVALRAVDPWVPADPPAYPGSDALFVWRTVPDDGSTHTLALAGATVDPEPLPADQAWALLAMQAHAPRRLYRSSVMDRLTERLRERPTEAHLALALQGRDHHEVATMLVASGLLWSGASMGQTADALDVPDEELARAVSASPVCGALVATRVLGASASPTTHPETWAAALESLGTAYREILAGGGDPHASVGRLEHTRKLDIMAREQYGDLLAALRVVPRAVLDPDNRQAGAIELFGTRKRKSVVEASGYAWGLSLAAVAALDSFGATPLIAVAKARSVDRSELDVAHLSTESLGLSLIARLAARGLPEAIAKLHQIRPHLTTLSRHAPRLLCADIVLAEAHICAMLTDDHPRFTDASQEDE